MKFFHLRMVPSLPGLHPRISRDFPKWSWAASCTLFARGAPSSSQRPGQLGRGHRGVSTSGSEKGLALRGKEAQCPQRKGNFSLGGLCPLELPPTGGLAITAPPLFPKGNEISPLSLQPSPGI